jgi:precorrin-6A synthase
MRKVWIIGIGVGDPDQLTVQAIAALNQVDVFFVADKGGERSEFADLREAICARFIPEPSYRVARFPDAQRAQGASYREAVDTWHREREQIYERLFFEELSEGEHGAFLAWGDPTLYDSTLALVEAIRARRAGELECEVIPGISSVSVLAARHRVAQNRIGDSIRITTGRKLREGFPPDADSVFVLLDGECSFRHCLDQDLEIFWGAYLGTPEELLVSGRLADVADEIVRVRAEARSARGWIMDAYLLRRRAND